MKKQKLKSERGNLHVGVMDMFMTMEPNVFQNAAIQLAGLRDTNKHGFDVLLRLFEKHKMNKPSGNYVASLEKKRFIRWSEKYNALLSALLIAYWYAQDSFDGGYFWCMFPNEKLPNESKEKFQARKYEMEDHLTQLELLVLQSCGYYEKY